MLIANDASIMQPCLCQEFAPRRGMMIIHFNCQQPTGKQVSWGRFNDAAHNGQPIAATSERPLGLKPADVVSQFTPVCIVDIGRVRHYGVVAADSPERTKGVTAIAEHTRHANGNAVADDIARGHLHTLR